MIELASLIWSTSLWFFATLIYGINFICTIKGKRIIFTENFIAKFWFVLGVVIGGIFVCFAWLKELIQL